MVSCLLNVGQGRLTLNEMRDIVDNPEKHWNHRLIEASPPYALYLLNVKYDEKGTNLSTHKFSKEYLEKCF
jgi:tRNA U38,U39,U40 pseudouridine synthase TruA